MHAQSAEQVTCTVTASCQLAVAPGLTTRQEGAAADERPQPGRHVAAGRQRVRGGPAKAHLLTVQGTTEESRQKLLASMAARAWLGKAGRQSSRATTVAHGIFRASDQCSSGPAHAAGQRPNDPPTSRQKRHARQGQHVKHSTGSSSGAPLPRGPGPAAAPPR